MHAGRVLINLQSALVFFYFASSLKRGRETFTTSGCSLREKMMWLNDLHEETIDDDPERLDIGSMILQLLSCSKESANSFQFWQCFRYTFLMMRFIDVSQRHCQDMLNQYVPEHHDGRAPLQLSAVNLAYFLATRERHETLRSLETMIVCIIESGADLHDATHYHTPLMVFLAYFTDVRRARSVESEERNGVAETRPRDLRHAIKAWLSILQRAGVNLVTYGAQESRIFQAFRSMSNPLPPVQSWYASEWYKIGDEIHYFTFSYGPTPQDWAVQLDMVEEYASDIWRMPYLLDESESPTVHGSWIDT
jgi:hypothetical protein